ncbi:MAG: hypothetical protein AAGJ87_01955 [Pseudomonadota bacterium]
MTSSHTDGARMNAQILSRAWRKIDIKLTIDGDMHILRWRRGWFSDDVFFDDRRVAGSTGLFGRETIYGLGLKTGDDEETKLLFTVDVAQDDWDWSGEMRPRGVRLETADRALVAFGSLGPDRSEPFFKLFDRAVKSLGLS